MREALRKNEDVAEGYWLFDGDNKYCEGRFVPFSEREGFDKVLEEETKCLAKIWDLQSSVPQSVTKKQKTREPK